MALQNTAIRNRLAYTECDEIAERQVAVAGVPLQTEGQRHEHHHERRVHHPRQASARSAARPATSTRAGARHSRERPRQTTGEAGRCPLAAPSPRAAAATCSSRTAGRSSRRPPPATRAAPPGDWPGRSPRARSTQGFQRTRQVRLLALRITQREGRAVLDGPLLQHQPGRHVDGQLEVDAELAAAIELRSLEIRGQSRQRPHAMRDGAGKPKALAVRSLMWMGLTSPEMIP